MSPTGPCMTPRKNAPSRSSANSTARGGLRQETKGESLRCAVHESVDRDSSSMIASGALWQGRGRGTDSRRRQISLAPCRHRVRIAPRSGFARQLT